jgi:predicted esterase
MENEFKQHTSEVITKSKDIIQGTYDMERYKILCLHGGGGSAASFSQQPGMQSLIQALPHFEFVFIDSPLSGVWWNDPVSKDQPTTNPQHANTSIEFIESYITNNGPFYGILGYSQGAAMVSVFLSYKPEISFQKVLIFNGYLPTTHQGLMSTINENSPLTTPALIFLGANDAFYELGLNVKSVYSNFQEVISTTAYHHLPYSNDSMFQTVKQFLY